METGTDVGVNHIKKEDIVKEIADTACFSFSKNCGAAMSKLFKTMALLCAIYDVDLTNIAEDHKLNVR